MGFLFEEDHDLHAAHARDRHESVSIGDTRLRKEFSGEPPCERRDEHIAPELCPAEGRTFFGDFKDVMNDASHTSDEEGFERKCQFEVFLHYAAE